ncbi:MAG: LPD23 domain-containing protein [Fermentimonas sp.]
MAGEKTRSQQMDALNSSEMELNNPNSASGGLTIETTKLLQGVEKSYDKGEKLLEESEDKPESTPLFRAIGEIGASRLEGAEMVMDDLRVAREMEADFNERPKRLEKLRNSKDVEISGKEHEGKYELNRNSAKQWLKDNLRGSYEIADTGEQVEISRKGVNKVTSHSMGSEPHLKSLIAIPELLHNSIFITQEQAEKDNAQYESYRYYVTGLKIGEDYYTAKLTVGVDRNGNRFYDHALTELEKTKLIDYVNQSVPGFISTGDVPNPSVTVSKDTKLLSILQADPKENAKKIRLATGWERGVDGKWRYEVADENIHWRGALNDGADKLHDLLNEHSPLKTIKLFELFENGKESELFKAYPELLAVKVRFGKSDGMAHWDSSRNEIVLERKYFDHDNFFDSSLIQSVLIHETQHAIQEIEGFAKGGDISISGNTIDAYNYHKRNADDITKALANYDKTELGKRMKEAIASGDFVQMATVSSERLKDDAFKVILDAKKAFKEEAGISYDKFIEGNITIEDFAKTRYNRLAGEVEARNVQRRLDFTPEQRRERLLEETEDVARAEQIVLRSVAEDADVRFRSEYEERLSDIKEKAIADGTFMKAPNGKDTNLNERQWLQVRTPEFKRFFGDWELANLIRQAKNAWEDKNSKSKSVISLSEKAAAKFKELLGTDAKQLVITDDTIRHIKNYHSTQEENRGQISLTPEDIAVIPFVVNNYDTMERAKEYDDKLGNRAVTIKKRINGISVVATIERGKSKEFVVSSWIVKKSDALDVSSETPGLYVQNDSDIANVMKEVERIKNSYKNSSKIVDENGV